MYVSTSDPVPKRKWPYLDTCLTKITVHHCIRKLSARSTTCIPVALSKNMVFYKEMTYTYNIYIHISIYTYVLIYICIYIHIVFVHACICA